MRTRVLAFLVMASLAAVPVGPRRREETSTGPSRMRPESFRRDSHDHNVDTGQTQTLVTNGTGYSRRRCCRPDRTGHGRHAELQRTEPERDRSRGRPVAHTQAHARSRDDLRASGRLRLVPLARYHRCFVGTELRPGADLRAADGVEHADSPRAVRAGRRQSHHAGAGDLGQIDGPTNAAGSVLGGVGGFNYTIDGATNAGSSRRIASSPNADMIEEMRVETSNFDAGQGHGTGGTIAMMTRAGSNSARHRQLPVLDQQDQFAEPAAEAGVLAASRDGEDLRGRLRELHRDDAGGSGGHSATGGRPQQAVLLCQLSAQLRQRAGPEHADEHVPANEKHLNGDFSDLLVPNGSVSDLRSADGAAGSAVPAVSSAPPSRTTSSRAIGS